MNFAYAAGETAQKVSVDFSATEAILQATLPVQLTLLILVVMSVVCWAVIFSKKKYMDAANEANIPFWDMFSKATSFEDVYDKLNQHPNSPLARIFHSGYIEMKKIAKLQQVEGKTTMLTGVDNIERALRRGTDIEIGNMESRLSILATTGSTGPFIGLFGTVWGIMGSFHKIGATGSASLATVAPGISEALIATAIGLLAAIPATAAYNHYITRIRREEIDMHSFASDFVNVTKRNFFKE